MRQLCSWPGFESASEEVLRFVQKLVDFFTGDYLDVPPENVIDSAHYGYVYAMAVLVRGEGEVLLVTGSGDETVKVRLILYSVPVLLICRC